MVKKLTPSLSATVLRWANRRGTVGFRELEHQGHVRNCRNEGAYRSLQTQITGLLNGGGPLRFFVGAFSSEAAPNNEARFSFFLRDGRSACAMHQTNDSLRTVGAVELVQYQEGVGPVGRQRSVGRSGSYRLELGKRRSSDALTSLTL